ncbi:hypothetical protein Sjap_009090 [Stephania japonica]|uniref:Uncharacterized protein n=1 Tax=Stephania japonica TaxID=461633 RepID=A0AAP0JRI6_9MAGN
MAALKLVMMGVVLVALLGASPPSVDARSHIPSILTTSESLENIDLDNVLVTDSNLNAKAISEVRSALDSLGINKGLKAGPPCGCGGKDCCDFEICTRSCPPQCSCQDVAKGCSQLIKTRISSKKGEGSMLERLKLCYLYAFHCNPQLVLCNKDVDSVPISALCIVSPVVLLQAAIRCFIHKEMMFPCKGSSDYEWSIWIIPELKSPLF